MCRRLGYKTQKRRQGGSENDDQAPISQYSVFPDGEYLVDVTATSQGSAFLASPSITQRYLPSENIDDPTSNEDPIVVDNHRPYVDSNNRLLKGFFRHQPFLQYFIQQAGMRTQRVWSQV